MDYSRVLIYYFSNCFLILFILTLVIQLSQEERIVKQKIYYELDSRHFCLRRLNATHQIGCQSSPSGNVGVLHLVKNDKDVEFVTNSGMTAPFIAATTLDTFTLYNLRKFRDSKRVVGVLLLYKKGDKRPPIYSPDYSCPNDKFSFYTRNKTTYAHCSKNSWNPESPSLSMLFEDWSFPIFLITSTKDHEAIYNCLKHNKKSTWPLCSAELTSLMFSAKDAKTCMRRIFGNFIDTERSSPFCRPLSSFNLFSPLFDLPSPLDSIENKSLIMLSSRIDASSMFKSMAPGADTSITSITVLLTVAKTLAEQKFKIKNPSKNVLFSLFDGESFDYIGSSRAAFDMKHSSLKSIKVSFEKPINISNITLENIHSFIDLSQLAPYDNPGKLFVHTDPISRNISIIDQEVNNITQFLRIASDGILEIVEVLSSAIPPSSFQSFLSQTPLPGMVLTNHRQIFSNKYYNSFLDDKDNIGLNNITIEHLTKVSTVISNALLKLITNEKITAESSQETVAELLNCFLVNSSCLLFQQVLPQIPKNPDYFSKEMSIGVIPTSIDHLNSVYLLQRVLILFLGESFESITNGSDCSNQSLPTNQFAFDWLPGLSLNGTCFKSQRFSTLAMSPIFDAQTMEPNWDSSYSTWTQSTWQDVVLYNYYPFYVSSLWIKDQVFSQVKTKKIPRPVKNNPKSQKECFTPQVNEQKLILTRHLGPHMS